MSSPKEEPNPPSRDRRRHVRVQPLPELPAALAIAGDLTTRLVVADISVGGIGVWIQRGTVDWEVAGRYPLSLKLGEEELDVEVSVRHITGDRTIIGTRFEDLSEDSQTRISRYVSELTERGA